MSFQKCTDEDMEYMIKETVQIVRDASRLMVHPPVLGVEQKGNDSNYVTEADLAVQRYLTEKLLALLPGSGMLGEEGEHEKTDGSLLWVVDPIDGTSNFIRDIGFSGISVGLVRRGEPVMGVIFNPYRDEMYRAFEGGGAFLNENPIHVSDRDFSHSHLCSAMSLYDKRFAKQCFNIIERVYNRADDLRRMGTASLELALLAAGRVELYFEMRLFPWDVAAAIPIIKEAGGYVRLLHHDHFVLDKPFPFVAANNRENFESLLEIVCDEIPVIPYDE